jgi:hypothetical protein
MSTVLRIFPAVLVLQAGTAILVTAAFTTEQGEVRLLSVAAALGMGAMACLWLASIANAVRRDAVARAESTFLREREQLKLDAERARQRASRRAETRLNRERVRNRGLGARGSVAVVGMAAGALALVVLSQAFVLGLAAATALGGALVGYQARARLGGTRRTNARAWSLPTLGGRLFEGRRTRLLSQPKAVSAG